MHCDETGEFVSALCDGETIPRAAAEHIGSCETCQARLRDYVGMGVELRCVASLEIDNAVEPRMWVGRARQQNTIAKWWQKGWGTMRIPRLAFVAMIAGIAVLGLTLAVDKVRAHDAGTVVLLKIARGDGEPMACPLSTQDKKNTTCASIGRMNGSTVGFRVDLLGHDGTRVQLGFRAKDFGAASGSFALADVDKEPQKELWFEPGETLKIDIDPTRTLTMTGEWMDHMPVIIGSSNPRLDPAADEMRMVSPMLLRDKMVVGDFEGATTTADKPGFAAWLYCPGEGSFLVSLRPLQGGVKAYVNLNRITFEENGRSYTILTGAPVSRAQSVWVLHQPDFKPDGEAAGRGFLSSRAVVQTAPGVWAPN